MNNQSLSDIKDMLNGQDGAANTYYLSALPVSHKNFSDIKDYSDLGIWHKKVMSFFPDNIAIDKDKSRLAGDILFRLELDNTTPRILVQSYIPFISDGVKSIPLDTLLETLDNNMNIIFQFESNFVKRDPKTRKLHGLNKKEIEERILGKDGQDTVLLGLENVAIFDIMKKKDLNYNGIALNMYNIKGRAKISNIDQLQNSILKGLGKTKAYGCGLLSILPNG
jgi:CRISPR system Cascade subunit CasE